jgi:tRNA pseudouridine65 synthase
MSELNILYQDDHLIAIDKPAGMLVHPGRDPEPDEQIAMKALRNYLGQYVYIVHRLDRPTSGVLVFTLSKEVQSKLSIQFQKWQVHKKYYAVALGETPAEFEVDTPVKRDDDSKPAPSLTKFKKISYVPKGVLAERDFTLLDVEPYTGRFHQIRRHLSWEGFPIVGDYLYGDIDENNSISDQIAIRRMMLMSYSLELTHPVTCQKLLIKTAMPPEFATFKIDS